MAELPKVGGTRAGGPGGQDSVLQATGPDTCAKPSCRDLMISDISADRCSSAGSRPRAACAKDMPIARLATSAPARASLSSSASSALAIRSSRFQITPTAIDPAMRRSKLILLLTSSTLPNARIVMKPAAMDSPAKVKAVSLCLRRLQATAA